MDCFCDCCRRLRASRLRLDIDGEVLRSRRSDHVLAQPVATRPSPPPSPPPQRNKWSCSHAARATRASEGTTRTARASARLQAGALSAVATPFRQKPLQRGRTRAGRPEVLEDEAAPQPLRKVSHARLQHVCNPDKRASVARRWRAAASLLFARAAIGAPGAARRTALLNPSRVC